MHKTPFECPNHLILFDDKHNDYRLIVHDGGPPLLKCLFFYGVVKNTKLLYIITLVWRDISK
ncbi:DUF6980 family protein [Priestia aryabhattai]|uniref:DUF6980 family protein n=1 Tax=Priestia aryabhattai TaxID=412384 RepID=UPI00366DF0AD